MLNTKKVRKTFITCFALLSLCTAQSQSKQDIVAEANRLEVDSRQAAMNALSSKGISEFQAREMAQMRGIDFDSFLNDYLKSRSSEADRESELTKKSNVITELNVVPLDFIVPDRTKEVRVETDATDFFGYAIFENNPFGQKEYLLGNIDEGYILAPGDELRITVFGDNNLEFVSKIDLNGNISFPNIGVFFAAGNSFATLKKRIKLFLGKYYSGLLSEPSRTFLDVSLTQIRPVKVTVLGNVNTPGPHLVSGLATVLNALYASGGVDTSGTLRDIKVYRNNSLIKSIDLYDYITQGNLDQDIRLSNNDIIFVGPRLSDVSLSGQVKKEAIYELKNTESLRNLFDYAGGLPAGASIKNINISRITPFQERSQQLVFDRFLTTVNYESIFKDGQKDFQLEDGDRVTVQGILSEQKNAVVVQGNVNVPGTYALDVFSDLKELIVRGANGLSKNTYLRKIDIQSVDKKGNLSFKTFDLSSVLNEELQVTLKENDTVKIYSLEEVEGAKTVRISGFGTKPKTIFWSKNLSIFDLIFQTVSYEELDFQAQVLASRLDVKRYDESTGMYNILQYSIDNLEELIATYLRPKDEVVLYTKSVTQDLEPTFKVLGSVVNPGEFSLGNNMYIEDAILMAEGFLESAEKKVVRINRLDRSVEKGTYSKMQTYQIDTDYLLGLHKKPKNPFVLRNHDVISVFAPIRALDVPLVNVQGEVKFPQNVVLQNDNISLKELVDVAGGLTKNSHLESSYVLRDSLKMFLNIDKNLSKTVAVLKKDDILVIGSKLASVKTAGALVNPTIFNWEKGKRAKYYISQSGGTKKRIESKVVVQANGKTEKISLFHNPLVQPGAEIRVIEKPEKIAGDGDKFLDDFVRIFGIITSTLTTVVLASQL
jgi:polysaccharide export outer membrane protein